MKTQTLHCEIGNHPWTRESKRGKPPRNCSEHKPVMDTKATPAGSGEKRVLTAEHKDKLQAGRKQKAREDHRSIISDILKRHPECRCGLRSDSTNETIRNLGGGCTSPYHVCPALDGIRRVLNL